MTESEDVLSKWQEEAKDSFKLLSADENLRIKELEHIPIGDAIQFEREMSRRILDLIDLIRKKDKALAFVCREEKLGEHGDPWRYRKAAAETALKLTEKLK